MANVTFEGSVARILFSGQLTLTACANFDAEVDNVLLKQPESVVFDLADVSFISSIFLRLCLKTFKKMGRDHFRIINSSPAVKRIFAISGLDEMVKNT